MEEKSHFKSDAKTIVDTLFDNKFFDSKLTRDDLNALEELVLYMMDARFNSAWKAKELWESIEKRTSEKK